MKDFYLSWPSPEELRAIFFPPKGSLARKRQRRNKRVYRHLSRALSPYLDAYLKEAYEARKRVSEYPPERRLQLEGRVGSSPTP